MTVTVTFTNLTKSDAVTPLASHWLSIRTVDAGGGAVYDGGTVVAPVRVQLDSTGSASVALPRNTDLTPAGTFYRITVERTSPTVVRHIRLTADTPSSVEWTLSDIQVINPVPPDYLDALTGSTYLLFSHDFRRMADGAIGGTYPSPLADTNGEGSLGPVGRYDAHSVAPGSHQEARVVDSALELRDAGPYNANAGFIHDEALTRFRWGFMLDGFAGSTDLADLDGDGAHVTLTATDAVGSGYIAKMHASNVASALVVEFGWGRDEAGYADILGSFTVSDMTLARLAGSTWEMEVVAGSPNTVNLYVNGELVGSATDSTYDPTGLVACNVALKSENLIAPSAWRPRVAVVWLTEGETWSPEVGYGSGSGGSGDVVGPAFSTNNYVALFDGTTGKLLKQGSGALGDAAYKSTGTSAGTVAPGDHTHSGTYQPLDSDLTAIAALSTTTFGRSLLEAANAAALRTLAGTVIGTDVLAPNGSGASLTGIYLPGGTDVAVADGGTGASTASGARTNLGLGTAATKNTGTTSSDVATGDAPQASRIKVVSSSRSYSGQVHMTPLVPGTGAGTVVIPAGTMIGAYAAHSGQTIATIGINVQSSSLSAGQAATIVIYNEASDGGPGTVAWSEDITVGTSTGYLSASISRALNYGGAWVFVLNKSTNAGSVTIRSFSPQVNTTRQVVYMSNTTWYGIYDVTSVSSPPDLSSYQYRSGSTTAVLNTGNFTTFPVVGALT